MYAVRLDWPACLPGLNLARGWFSVVSDLIITLRRRINKNLCAASTSEMYRGHDYSVTGPAALYIFNKWHYRQLPKINSSAIQSSGSGVINCFTSSEKEEADSPIPVIWWH